MNSDSDVPSSIVGWGGSYSQGNQDFVARSVGDGWAMGGWVAGWLGGGVNLRRWCNDGNVV